MPKTAQNSPAEATVRSIARTGRRCAPKRVITKMIYAARTGGRHRSETVLIRRSALEGTQMWSEVKSADGSKPASLFPRQTGSCLAKRTRFTVCGCKLHCNQSSTFKIPSRNLSCCGRSSNTLVSILVGVFFTALAAASAALPPGRFISAASQRPLVITSFRFMPLS